MKAGLTGWAQVNGLNGDTSLADRAAADNSYIDNWSLWLDLVILARTARLAAAELAGHLRPAAPQIAAPRALLSASSIPGRGGQQ